MAYENDTQYVHLTVLPEPIWYTVSYHTGPRESVPTERCHVETAHEQTRMLVLRNDGLVLPYKADGSGLDMDDGEQYSLFTEPCDNLHADGHCLLHRALCTYHHVAPEYRCIVGNRLSQCEEPMSAFRLCREHWDEQQTLLEKGDSLDFIEPYTKEADWVRYGEGGIHAKAAR